jgi:GT2 family glycosyltransferase
MKTKTAAIILNHNMPDMTDMLFEALKPYEREDYDLIVLDNGSKPEGTSKYAYAKLDDNVYFGGGLNAAMHFVKENEQYDSLLFLSNDLTIHPYNFVRTLREEMFIEVPDGYGLYGPPRGIPIKTKVDICYDIVAPTFYNVEANQQCHWKVMHSRCSKETRRVPYVDFQCPLISKRLIEAVGSIDPDLIYGWGPDWLFALTAKKLGYKLGVVDRACVLHHNSLTVKRGVAGLDIPTYCRLAEEGMRKFFMKTGAWDDYMNLRKETEKYEYKNE